MYMFINPGDISTSGISAGISRASFVRTGVDSSKMVETVSASSWRLSLRFTQNVLPFVIVSSLETPKVRER